MLTNLICLIMRTSCNGSIASARRESDTMATIATDGRLRHRHVDGGSDRPRPSAVGVHRLPVPVADDAREQDIHGADRASGHRGTHGTIEAFGPECARMAGQAQADRDRAREHHGDPGLYRHAPLETVTPI